MNKILSKIRAFFLPNTTYTVYIYSGNHIYLWDTEFHEIISHDPHRYKTFEARDKHIKKLIRVLPYKKVYNCVKYGAFLIATTSNQKKYYKLFL